MAGETYQSCNRVGELVKLSNEWPMTVSYQYLTFFIDTRADEAKKIIKVDRRTLKLDNYAFPKNMSCKVKDISADYAI